MLGKSLGALILCAAVAVPVQLLGARTAGAIPNINFVLTTESGTGVLLDASGSPNVGGVSFELSGGTLIDKIVAPAIPTIYGWLALWDTTMVPDGTYSLQTVTSYPPPNVLDSGTSSGVTITVAN